MLQGRLHPALHVLQRRSHATPPANRVPQRRRLHHVHDLLLRQQRLPRQPLHDSRPEDGDVERAARDDGHGSGRLPRSWHWQWILLELSPHDRTLNNFKIFFIIKIISKLGRLYLS